MSPARYTIQNPYTSNRYVISSFILPNFIFECPKHFWFKDTCYQYQGISVLSLDFTVTRTIAPPAMPNVSRAKIRNGPDIKTQVNVISTVTKVDLFVLQTLGVIKIFDLSQLCC